MSTFQTKSLCTIFNSLHFSSSSPFRAKKNTRKPNELHTSQQHQKRSDTKSRLYSCKLYFTMSDLEFNQTNSNSSIKSESNESQGSSKSRAKSPITTQAKQSQPQSLLLSPSSIKSERSSNCSQPSPVISSSPVNVPTKPSSAVSAPKKAPSSFNIMDLLNEKEENGQHARKKQKLETTPLKSASLSPLSRSSSSASSRSTTPNHTEISHKQSRDI